MEIALRSLTELAVHVKLASEAILAAARHLAAMSPEEGPDGTAWCRAMDELVTMNVQLQFMERILSMVTREGVAVSPGGRGARLLTS